jgi:hypothetical protein
MTKRPKVTRAAWDSQVDAETHELLHPAVDALSRVAGELEGWRYAALHELLVGLATEAAHARTTLSLGPQPPLPAPGSTRSNS